MKDPEIQNIHMSGLCSAYLHNHFNVNQTCTYPTHRAFTLSSWNPSKTFSRPLDWLMPMLPPANVCHGISNARMMIQHVWHVRPPSDSVVGNIANDYLAWWDINFRQFLLRISQPSLAERRLRRWRKETIKKQRRRRDLLDRAVPSATDMVDNVRVVTSIHVAVFVS